LQKSALYSLTAMFFPKIRPTKESSRGRVENSSLADIENGGEGGREAQPNFAEGRG
jgi:hypothetical protein